MVMSDVTVVLVGNNAAVAAGMDELLIVRLSGPCTHSSRVICADATLLGEQPRRGRARAEERSAQTNNEKGKSPLAVYRWTPPAPLLQSTAVHRSLPVYQSTTQSTVHRVHQESTGVHRVDGGLFTPQVSTLVS